MLEQAGLKPAGLDIVPCALFRSFERSLRRQEDKEQTFVFIDIGGEYTTMVFGRSGQISFIKQIAIGGEQLNQNIAARLGVSVEEAAALRDKLRTETSFGPSALTSESGEGESAGQGQLDVSVRQNIIDSINSAAEELSREISLCFRYYTVTFRGKRIERAIFSGGQAYDNILLSSLRRQLTVEIEVAQPIRGFNISRSNGAGLDSDRRGFLCEWTVAVGLCLKLWKPFGSEAVRSVEYAGN